MSVCDRFKMGLSPLKLPSAATPTGYYPRPVKEPVVWEDADSEILPEVESCLAGLCQDRVFSPPAEDEHEISSEPGLCSALWSQVKTVQKALRLRKGVRKTVTWDQQTSKGQALTTSDPAVMPDGSASSYSVVFTTSHEPLRGSRPDFELLEDGIPRTFLEVKLP